MVDGQRLWEAHLERERETYRLARMVGVWIGRQRSPVRFAPHPHMPLSAHHAILDSNESELRANWFASAKECV
jgi:hypothetical protein